MHLAPDGAQHLASALNAANLADLERALGRIPADSPGTRLSGNAALAQLISRAGPIGLYAAGHLGPAARPVRALFFNKTPGRNWGLGWHQDRTIVVQQRIEAPGFTHWTVKSGMLHVEPPFNLLERMLTIRAHLDPVGPANAPLLIIPGSHRLGRIRETRIARIVEQGPVAACLAEAGDIWLYATPILHASEAAAEPLTRRVLQVDYSADELPPGLHWLGV